MEEMTKGEREKKMKWHRRRLKVLCTFVRLLRDNISSMGFDDEVRSLNWLSHIPIVSSIRVNTFKTEIYVLLAFKILLNINKNNATLLMESLKNTLKEYNVPHNVCKF